MNFVWFLLIGLAAGFIAGKLMKGHGFGLIGNLIVGVIGSMLGGWLFDVAGVMPGNLIGELVAAVVGACVLLFLLGVISGKKR